MACRFDSRGVWTCIVYAFLTAGVADNPVRPAPTELSTRIYCFEHFDDFHSNAPRNLALQTMPELTLTSKGTRSSQLGHVQNFALPACTC